MKDKKEILQDPRFIQLKRNLKARSKGELIFLLFETHHYLEVYKNAYMKLIESLKKKSSEKEQRDESSTVESINVIESKPTSGDGESNSK